MKVTFAYGEKGLDINLPDDLAIDVIKAKPDPPIIDPHQELLSAMNNPLMTKSLKEMLKKRPSGKICVVISDSTRPVPSKIILNTLIKIFEELRIPDSDVQILIATGLHRKSKPEEIRRMVSIEIIERFDIINHVAEDPNTLEFIGNNSFGTPVYINKTYVEAGFKIITGYVEPHFFAGFSGGRKALIPGIAGAETIQMNHSAKNIGSEMARFGILKGNPIYEDAIDSVKMKQIKPDFMINVCINPKHQITKVVAGSLQAYNELVKYQEQLCFYPIQEPYDIIITGNGGFPLDLNLYQAVKSMALGELGVKKGGTVISVNECRDNVGQPKFKELINLGICAEEMFSKVTQGEIKCSDQWEIQALARVLTHADVYVVSTMQKEDLGTIGLKYAPTVESAIDLCRKKYGDKMRVLVLPDGPSMIPKLVCSK